MTTYAVHVTNPAGSLNTTLTHATPAAYSDELNGPGSASFEMGLYDSQALLCDPSLGREVAIYRNGTVVWAGPIKSDDVDVVKKKVTFRCAGLLDYFAGRNIDRGAGRVNYLDNPEFEVDAVTTTPITSWPATGVTSAVDDAQHVLGSKSAKLTQASAGVDTYISQTVSVTAGPIGLLLTVVGWAFIDDTGSWVGPALESWGLIVRQLDPGTGEPVAGGQGFRGDENLLDSDTPRGTWQRYETTTWIAPGVTSNIEVRLYAPGGVVWWDATSMTVMESLSGPQEDQATIASGIVDFLQAHSIYSAMPKSELNITTDCPATGVLRDFAYQFADHTSGEVALSAFPKMRTGFDYWISPADRVFHTAYPSRGSDLTGSVTLVGDSNCIVKRRTFDLAQGANDVVQLGAGDGPDREEGGATDLSVFGGVTWQRILAPNANPPIDTLRPTAEQDLAVARTPVHYEVDIIDPALTLTIGDTVAVAFNHGYVQETRDLRVVTTSRSPTSDILTVGLNVADGSSRVHLFGTGTFGDGTFGGY